MHIVVRRYTGSQAAELIRIIQDNEAAIAEMMKGVPSLVSWRATKMTGGDLLSATVCQDKAGCDASTEAVKKWIAKNAPDVTFSPEIEEGEVFEQVVA